MTFRLSRVLAVYVALAACALPARTADFAAPGGFPSQPAPQGAHNAAEIARVQTGGRVLDVRPALDRASSEYEVRVLLDEGRVRRVVVDIESGQMK